jgi:hypothetical protein
MGTTDNNLRVLDTNIYESALQYAHIVAMAACDDDHIAGFVDGQNWGRLPHTPPRAQDLIQFSCNPKPTAKYR